MELVKIKTEFIKLDQLLKYASIVSTGGEAKVVISEDLVIVNGEIATQRGKKIRHGDIIKFDGIEYKVENE